MNNRNANRWWYWVVLFLFVLAPIFLAWRAQTSSAPVASTQRTDQPTTDSGLVERTAELPKEVAAAVVHSDETALADQQPLDRLAVALSSVQPPDGAVTDPAHDPAVAAEIAGALLVAADRQWNMRMRSNTQPILAAWADYWLQIWPDLDRYVADGTIGRVVAPIAVDVEHPDAPVIRNACIITGDMNKITCTVNADKWSVSLIFDRDHPPLPEAFTRVFGSTKRKA